MAGKEENHSISKILCLGVSVQVGHKQTSRSTAGAEEGPNSPCLRTEWEKEDASSSVKEAEGAEV